MTHLRPLPILSLLLSLAGCASSRAPEMAGAVWAGQSGQRIQAELRVASEPLPEGWVVKAPPGYALGSFFYRKRSGKFDYSSRGYFAVETTWRSDGDYVGVLHPGGSFCVLNPEMQADVAGDRVTTYRVYDYCVQLRRR